MFSGQHYYGYRLGYCCFHFEEGRNYDAPFTVTNRIRYKGELRFCSNFSMTDMCEDMCDKGN